MSDDFLHISTKEIQLDLALTKKEALQYRDELQALNANPTENKVRIYMTSGKLSQREQLINQLTTILKNQDNQQ